MLILLWKLNSKISNLGFNDKKIAYKDCQMLSTKEIIKYDDWNVHTIEERTQKLLEWAAKEWVDIEIN